MHSNGTVRRQSFPCLSTAIGFPIFVGHSTPVQILIDRLWPSLGPSTSQKTLLEMVSLLNTQWLCDPSIQWLPFLACDWRTLLDAVSFLSQGELSVQIIKFWKFVVVASREMKVIYDAISFKDLLQILVKSYLKCIESPISMVAEHLLDLFVIYLNIYSASEFLDLALVAYSRCSVLWGSSEIFKDLLLAFSMKFQHPATPVKLQQAAFRLLPRAIEPTDRRLMEALAFGEHPDLCALSPSLLKALVFEFFPETLTLPPSPSSLLLASFLLPPQKRDGSLHSIPTYPNEREIFATDGDSDTILSASFFTPLLACSNRIYLPSLADVFYSKEYFSRTLSIQRVDLAQELKLELLDIAKRLAPAPPRWARMGCWLAPGSPSLMEVSGCALGEFLPAWISLSLEIILPPLSDVVDEWESLKKGDLLFMMHLKSSVEILAVKACEFEGFLSSDGRVLESLGGFKRKRLAESTSGEHRILVVRVYPENVEEGNQFKFNVLVRRDPKCAPFKFFLKALKRQAVSEKSIPILQNHFREFTPEGNMEMAVAPSALSIALNTVDKPVVILGPPGSGKTRAAAEIAVSMYNRDENAKILLITHNHATLDLLLKRLVDMVDFSFEHSTGLSLVSMRPSHFVRLGVSNSFATDSSSPLTASGRLALIEERRVELLNLVDQMAKSLGLDAADHGATCDSAETFFLTLLPLEIKSDPYVVSLFSELRRLRPLEVLPSQNERVRYLLAHEARIVAATISQLIKSSELRDLPLKNFFTIIVDNACAILDSELSLIASLFESRQLILIGDHMMLPPVTRSPIISEHIGAERSLYANLIRRYEGGAIPITDQSAISILPCKWRCREEIAALFAWRYARFANSLPKNSHPASYAIEVSTAFGFAENKGFSHTFQWIDVERQTSQHGWGESEPVPNYFQNIDEAEYAVAIFKYMIKIGYDPSSISILAMYNGQKDLISDILKQKSTIMPKEVSSVDHYQGLSNDFIILSMVRTRRLGHTQDLRRWITSISRCRLGLYVLGNWKLFNGAAQEGIVAFGPSLEIFAEKPLSLVIKPQEDEITISNALQLDSITLRTGNDPQPSASDDDEDEDD